LQPFSRFVRLGAVEVTPFGGRERLAEDRHAFLPFLLAGKRQSFDVPEMLYVELDVLP
jgi:hypothetical protein